MELKIGSWYTSKEWGTNSYIKCQSYNKDEILGDEYFQDEILKKNIFWFIPNDIREVTIYKLLKLDFLPQILRERYQYRPKNNKIEMKEKMLDILSKTYDNPILRRTTIPLFMSNPGIGKTSIIKSFAKNKGVKMTKITLSQRMPNEVVGMMMPDRNTGKLVVYDSYDLVNLKDGDILFFDEVFNGTLKQTLDAVLNLLEDRMLPSGKNLADVMIVAASNPQGLINLTPQIKERFIKYDLVFNEKEYQTYLKEEYAMPKSISKNLCILINKEKFESAWDYITPRSVEKAINQIGCDLESPYDDLLIPYLSEEIESPGNIDSLNIKKDEKIPYIQLLKLFIKNKNQKENVNKNQKQEIDVAANLSC
jgi:hypothetical protein